MRYAALSFDLDGTLIDTAAEIAEAANRTLEDVGLPRQDEAVIRDFIGAGTRQMMLGTLEHVRRLEPVRCAAVSTDHVLERLEVHYGATVGLSARPYEGCVDALHALRAAGVRLACVTNKEERFAVRVLAATGLADCFELVIGGDTLAFRKPDPRTVEHVLSAFGVPSSQAAHIGDSRIDIETARAAGVDAWAVPWGYNAGVPIAETQPDRLFDSLPAVADWVCRANQLPQA